MKRFLSVLLLIAAACTSSGQSLTPFFYQPSLNEFHSMAAQSGSYFTASDTAGSTLDTIKLSPRYNVTDVKITAVDSFCIDIRSAAGAWYGDVMNVDVISPVSLTTVFVLGTAFEVATGTNRIAITANKRSHMRFFFNGVDWVEEARNLNLTK